MWFYLFNLKENIVTFLHSLCKKKSHTTKKLERVKCHRNKTLIILLILSFYYENWTHHNCYLIILLMLILKCFKKIKKKNYQYY